MSSTPERIRELFDQAVTLSASERSALFQRLLDEPEIVLEVRQLLQAADTENSLLQRTPLQPPKPLEPGDRIGPYRVDQLLGRGGMGIVYRATRVDKAFDKTVAIKIVSTGVGIEAFRRERQILATLEHPNIARLLDGGATVDGTPYLVMEFVAGRTFTDRAAIASMPVRDRVRQFLEICEGVEYLHRNLIVHRDLKPANILVTADGTPKLLDFGISKILQEDAASSDVTRTVGLTPRYASPEQILQKPVTTASDIYSLGVILYELLTNGGYPYETTGSGEAHVYLDAALHGSAKAPGVDPDLDAVTMKAIARDPADRYRSVAEFRADLERYLGSLPVMARSAGWGYAVRKFIARQKALVAAIGFAALALGGGVWGVLREARVATEQKTIAERSAAALRAANGEQTRLRNEAEKQRKRAEEQLGRARSLVSTMLFEIHDSMQFLQGSSEVKAKILRTSLQQLEQLTAEAVGSSAAAEMQVMLLRAYERAGNLALGAPGEKSSNPKQAIEYYQKVLDRNGQLPDSQRLPPLAIAQLHTKYASTLQRLGQPGASWHHIGEALRILAASEAKTTPEGRKLEAVATANACQIAGSQQMPETEAICLRAARLTEALPDNSQEDPRALDARGANYSLLATNAAKRNETRSALTLMRAASGAYSNCLKRSPRDSNCIQGLAVTGTYIGLWLEQVNDPNAEQAHRDALDIFRNIEEHTPGQTAMNYGRAAVEKGLALMLFRSGRKSAEARDLYRTSLDRLRGLFDKFEVAAIAKNDYADELLQSPWSEFRNDAEALRVAEQAVAATMRHPGALDTLAKAQLAMGRPADALKTAEEALERARKLKIAKLVREIEFTVDRVRKSI